QLAVRDGSLPAGGLRGARQGRHRGAAGSRRRERGCRRQRRRPSRRRSPDAAPRARGRARPLPRLGGRTANDDCARRPEPDAHGALSRRRGPPRASRLSRRVRADASRPAAAGDAVLPDAVDDAAAGILGGAGRGEDAVGGGRAGAPAARLPARRAAVIDRRRADVRAGVALLAPAVLVLGALAAWPGVWVLWLSLQQRIPIFGIDRFIGLAHYRFLAGDARFWNAIRVTIVFSTVSVALELALGVAVALALQRLTRGRRLAVTLLLLPWALPSVVVGRAFEWLYHPSAGLVNFVLGGRAVNWLGEPALALPALIAADVWRTMP